MKRILLWSFVLFLGIFYVGAQCPTSDVVLKTQNEVDTFVATYATTCTDIPVSITITRGGGGGHISDISGLSFITSINGSLEIRETQYITNVNFNNLTTVTGDIIFFRNSRFDVISGFDNLTNVGGSINFRQNVGLDEISGFNNLVTVGSSIHFYHFVSGIDFNVLSSIDLITGFNSVQNIGGDLEIYANNDITFNAFANLENIGGDLSFDETDFISFTGLTQLERIDGDISFSCAYWTDAEVDAINNFTSLTSIGGDISLTGSGGLGTWEPACSTSVGLDFLTNLITVEGDILFYRGNLRSGPPALETIGGNIEIQNSYEFCELPSIKSIAGDILVLNGDLPTNTSLIFPSLETLGGDIRAEGLTSSQTIQTIQMDNLSYLGGDILIEGFFVTVGDISINSLTHMDGSIKVNLFLSSSSSLTMNSLQTMGGNLDIKYSNSNLVSFNNLYAINGNLDIKSGSSIDIFDLLFAVGGNVKVIGNYDLQSLNGLETIQNIGGSLIVKDNSSLTDCSAICEYVANNTNYNISNNTLSCITTQTCTSNTIEGTIQNDIDFNGCTVTDLPLENIQVTASDGVNNFTTYTNANGEYSIVVPTGSYVVSSETITEAISITPASQNVTFAGTNDTQVIDFCVTFDPVIPVDDISLTVAPVYIAVPGFEARYSIVLENQGTTTQNGTINFTYSGANLNFTSATTPPTTQATNLLTWDYTNLIPGETRSIIAYFDVLPPPTNNIGDLLTFSGNAPLASDANPNNNQDNIFQVVLSSFDPNDKTVIEGEHLLIDDLDEYLHYVIRFQNEGTAPAVNIRITDIMSNLIDWDSFEPLDASHEYSVALVSGDDQKLEFLFDNIYLPDSTNDEPNSHGYIAFRVKPKNTLQVGDIINNRAAIYFDFNAPIITNQTKTRIVEDTDGDGIYNYQDNCPNTANTDQNDTDGDGMGDACDDDDDNDGILDVDDNCPLVASNDLDDNDGDGLGNVCDDDDDDDGILDINDNCPFTANTDQNDTDGDGMGDVCDEDDDNDGILDVDDNCPFTINTTQNDNDGDGLGDDCDDDDDDDGILDINDDCPYYAGTTTNGCPFTLPADNYLIETESETCTGLGNANIHIQTTESHNYEATLTQNGVLINLPVNTFTRNLSIENLTAGTYELCISIPTENYEQCFSINIVDPAELNANSSLAGRNEYNLDLKGATNYSIFINGEEHTIIAPDENTLVTFTKQLTAPVNNIEVKTEKECQGKFTETLKIATNSNFIVHPNPTKGEVYLSLITPDTATDTQINVYDISGKLLLNQTINTPLNNYKLNTPNLGAGVYFIQLVTKHSKYTQRLIKK